MLELLRMCNFCCTFAVEMRKIVRVIGMVALLWLMSSCQSRERKAEELTCELVSALERNAPMDTLRAIAEQDKDIVFYIFDARQAVYWSSNRLAADAIYLYAYDTWRDMTFANARGRVRWTKAGMYNILTVLPTGYTEWPEDAPEPYPICNISSSVSLRR